MVQDQVQVVGQVVVELPVAAHLEPQELAAHQEGQATLLQLGQVEHPLALVVAPLEGQAALLQLGPVEHPLELVVAYLEEREALPQ